MTDTYEAITIIPMWGWSNFYTCRECHKRKRGNYFISETLCKKCAAKRRLPVDNPIIKLEEGIAVTKRVKGLLEKEAGAKIPKTFRDIVTPFVCAIIVIGLWIGTGWVAIYLRKQLQSFKLLKILMELVALFGGLTLSCLALALVFKWLQGPRRRKIENLTIQFGIERRQRIEEAQQFYASPEWRYLRKKIIEEHKNICKSCGKIIRRAKDITVDHILPRSKYPNLALELTNLQVLCRSCNASKSNFVPP